MHPARENNVPPAHASSAVSPVIKHIVRINTPKKKHTKPKLKRKNFVMVSPPI
jgi:hypothetical protein